MMVGVWAIRVHTSPVVLTLVWFGLDRARHENNPHAHKDPPTEEALADSTDSAAADAARISSEEEDDDNEELAQETVEDDGESSDGGQTTDDDLDGDDFVCPPGVEVLATCPSGGACANMSIYYRYDSGWAKGTVTRLVEHSDNRSLNGLFAKFCV